MTSQHPMHFFFDVLIALISKLSNPNHPSTPRTSDIPKSALQLFGQVSLCVAFALNFGRLINCVVGDMGADATSVVSPVPVPTVQAALDPNLFVVLCRLECVIWEEDSSLTPHTLNLSRMTIEVAVSPRICFTGKNHFKQVSHPVANWSVGLHKDSIFFA